MLNFRKVIFLPLADKMMGTTVSRSYKNLKRLQDCSNDEVRKWQNEKLNRLIHQCYFHSVYYRGIFEKLGLKPDDILSIEDLEKLPVLSKDDIRNNYKDIVPDNLSELKYKRSATGGSTGDPLMYLSDYNSWSMSNANNIMNWENTGYRYGDKYVALGSTSLNVHKRNGIKHRIYYKLKGKIGLNGINMSDIICKEYINFIVQHGIRYIYGYASAIYLLARYAINKNKHLDIKACYSTSEVLTESFRTIIEEAFNCKVMDCYGANDGGLTAYSEESGFYKVGYNCLIRQESINENGVGSILVTDLSNFAMPFINYRLGDEILIDRCKNISYPYNGQIINKVLGRSSDILFLKNGRVLTGPGFTVLFKDIPVEYYCIEKLPDDSITCWLIKLPGYNSRHEKAIIETLRHQAGDDTIINIKYTRQPFINKAGKRKYFIDSSNENGA